MFNYDPAWVEKAVSCGFDPDRAMQISKEKCNELQEKENESFYKEIRKAKEG